jgi:hypothetical protein
MDVNPIRRVAEMTAVTPVNIAEAAKSMTPSFANAAATTAATTAAKIERVICAMIGIGSKPIFQMLLLVFARASTSSCRIRKNIF